MPSVRITFDEKALIRGVNRAIDTKLKKGLSDEVKRFATERYADRVAEYVPYKTGALLRSNSIVPDGDGYAVRYSAYSKKGYNYAGVQYAPEEFGKDEAFWTRTTPGTYSHWNRHLSATQRLLWHEEVADLIVEKMNNG